MQHITIFMLGVISGGILMTLCFILVSVGSSHRDEDQEFVSPPLKKKLEGIAPKDGYLIVDDIHELCNIPVELRWWGMKAFVESVGKIYKLTSSSVDMVDEDLGDNRNWDMIL